MPGGRTGGHNPATTRPDPVEADDAGAGAVGSAAKSTMPLLSSRVMCVITNWLACCASLRTVSLRVLDRMVAMAGKILPWAARSRSM